MFLFIVFMPLDCNDFHAVVFLKYTTLCVHTDRYRDKTEIGHHQDFFTLFNMSLRQVNDDMFFHFFNFRMKLSTNIVYLETIKNTHKVIKAFLEAQCNLILSFDF